MSTQATRTYVNNIINTRDGHQGRIKYAAGGRHTRDNARIDMESQGGLYANWLADHPSAPLYHYWDRKRAAGASYTALRAVLSGLCLRHPLSHVDGVEARMLNPEPIWGELERKSLIRAMNAWLSVGLELIYVNNDNETTEEISS